MTRNKIFVEMNCKAGNIHSLSKPNIMKSQKKKLLNGVCIYFLKEFADEFF